MVKNKELTTVSSLFFEMILFINVMIYYELLLVETKKLITNKTIALMNKSPLKVSPAIAPANPSPTFSPITCKVVKKTRGEERVKIQLAIFHVCLYFFAIKKIRVLKAIRRKRNIINEFIISSFCYKCEFSIYICAF